MRNFIVTIDGKQYQVGVEEVGVSTSTQTAPVQQVVVPQQPAQAPVQQATSQPSVSNGTKITAPMPGLIKKLSLSEGAQVKKGDVVLVLEAMKMDNDITATCDGVVSYKTTAGSNVDTGAVLVIIG